MSIQHKHFGSAWKSWECRDHHRTLQQLSPGSGHGSQCSSHWLHRSWLQLPEKFSSIVLSGKLSHNQCMSRQAGSAPAQARLIPIGWEAAGSVLHSLARYSAPQGANTSCAIFGQNCLISHPQYLRGRHKLGLLLAGRGGWKPDAPRSAQNRKQKVPERFTPSWLMNHLQQERTFKGCAQRCWQAQLHKQGCEDQLQKST